MGLVMAPPLSVLPVAATLDPAASASQSAGTTDATVTDTFAALLAMLAQCGPTVAVPVKALVDPGVALPEATPAPVKPDDTTSEVSPLAAALAAMLMLPAAMPAPSADPATAADAGPNISLPPTPGTAPAAPLTASLPSIAPAGSAPVPTLPAAPSSPDSSDSYTAANATIGAEAESSLAPAAAPPPALADAVRSAVATIAGAPPLAGEAAMLTDAVRSAVATITEAPLPPGASAIAAAPTEGSVRKPPAEAQPPGTPAPQGVEISVVRSVGNAQQAQTTGDGADGSANSGQKHDTAVPKPDGQLTSSTIAVVAGATTVAPSAAAAAPQTTAPVHAAPQPVEQVARAVIDTAEHGGGEVHIRLDPPELGAVTIHVRIDGNRVQVQVQAERNDAMNLLRQSTIDLSSLLGNRGLNLTDVNVGLGGRQAPGGDQPNPNQAAAAANGEFASILGVDETPAAELHNRLQSAYNPDGLHIYRV